MGNLKNLKPFKKGHKKLGGRKAGVPNRFPRDLRDAILAAAENVGSDGLGRDGLVGYFIWLATKRPRIFVKLLLRLLSLEAKQPPVTEPPSWDLRLLTEEEFVEFRRLIMKIQVVPPPDEDDADVR